MTEFINDIFKISVMCSGVILIFMLVRKIVGKKTGAWWRSIVWLLLLVRLCLPISISSSISIFRQDRVDAVTSYISPMISSINETVDITKSNAAEEDIQESNTVTEIQPSSLDNIDITTNPKSANANTQTVSANNIISNPVNWLQLAYYTYICGVIVSIVYLAIRMLTLVISLKRYDRCTDKRVLQLFDNVKQTMGIRRKVSILVDNNKSVPALCGVFSPILILPKNTIQSMTDRQLEYVFIHELTHLKRWDVLKLWTIEFALCIHWFNPIIYIARPFIRQDIELACDESIVMKLRDESFIDYCNVLMMSSIKKYRPIPGVITANLAGRSGKKLKERLVMINNFNKKKIIVSGVALLIALVLVLAACTTKGINVDKAKPDVSKEGLHLGVTVDEMQSKISMLSEEYSKLRKQYDENPWKNDNGTYLSNIYSSIEVDDKPTINKDENGLTLYKYKIRNNEVINVFNDNYEIEEYKYSDEMVENKAINLFYLMSEDDKYIKEITIEYDNSDNIQNSSSYRMFETIVKQAFIMVKDNNDTFVNCNKGDWLANQITHHELYTTGRAYENNVMYCYDYDSHIRTESITPVYDPDTPMFKMRDDSLAITPDEVNGYIKNEVIGFIDYFQKEINKNINAERAQKDLELFSSIDTSFKDKKTKDKSGSTVLNYRLAIDKDGKDIFTLMYLLDSKDEYIVSIQLDYIRPNNAEYKEMYDFLDKLLGVAVVELKKNFKSPSTEILHSTSRMAFDNTVVYNRFNDYGKSYTIIKFVENIKGLNITPTELNEKIKYLQENNLLSDIPNIKLSNPRIVKSVYFDKLVYEYTILIDDNNQRLISLAYVIALDGSHIESVAIVNNDIEKNSELYIDLNLLVKSACELALDDGKAIDDIEIDRPNDVFTLKRQLDGAMFEAEQDIYITIVKTSEELRQTTIPLFDIFLSNK